MSELTRLILKWHQQWKATNREHSEWCEIGTWDCDCGLEDDRGVLSVTLEFIKIQLGR